jgi:electron transport complex protein RnfD
MKLLNISSPHATRAFSTSNVMLWVLSALVPGIIALTYFFGPGHLIQIAIAASTALICEAAVMKARKRPVMMYLKDYSALLTAVLLAVSLPPYAPYWVTIIASAFAIIVAKNLYGGLGQNPFNPAMIGFALVLVSFPVPMTTSWSAPAELLTTGISFSDALYFIFTSRDGLDAFTSATPLDEYKHQIVIATASEVYQNPLFKGQNQHSIVLGWQWVSAAYLLGGVVLIWKKIFTWHIPVSLLAALTLCSLIFGWDSDIYVPTSMHLLAGATMLAAFFIATDPVTASTTPLGKLIYGAGIGVFIFVIRTWGAYPDAVAFAVLLMNFAAPFIDQYTQPRTYGHTQPKRGLADKK